jgi:hypothetical protein
MRNVKSPGSAVGLATAYLGDREVGVRVRLSQEFSLLHIAQAGSGVHPTSYRMDNRGFFPGDKAAGEWN